MIFNFKSFQYGRQPGIGSRVKKRDDRELGPDFCIFKYNNPHPKTWTPKSSLLSSSVLLVFGFLKNCDLTNTDFYMLFEEQVIFPSTRASHVYHDSCSLRNARQLMPTTNVIPVELLECGKHSPLKNFIGLHEFVKLRILV